MSENSQPQAPQSYTLGNILATVGILIQTIKVVQKYSQDPNQDPKLWLALDAISLSISYFQSFGSHPRRSRLVPLLVVSSVVVSYILVLLLPQPAHALDPSGDYAATGKNTGFSSYFTSQSDCGSNSNLPGCHVVQISPVANAQLNPDKLQFCLSNPSDSVFVPILLKGLSTPSHIRYFVSANNHIDDSSFSGRDQVDLSKKDLNRIEKARQAAGTKRNAFGKTNMEHTFLPSSSHSLVYIQVSKPGTIRLDQILDSSRVGARILFPDQLTIVPCPRAEFALLDASVNYGGGANPRSFRASGGAAQGSGAGIWGGSAGGQVSVGGPRHRDFRCAGEETHDQLLLDIFGVPPLTLKWSRTINGRTEHYTTEAIEAGSDFSRGRGYAYTAPKTGNSHMQRERYASQSIQEFQHAVTIALNPTGDHLYSLEEIRDGVENIIRLPHLEIAEDGKSVFRKARTTRSFTVLPKTAISFKNCDDEKGLNMLLGHEALLTIGANVTETPDSVWEVHMRYEPPEGEEAAGARTRSLIPWERTFRPNTARQEVIVPVGAPGYYSLVRVQGQWCPGEILEPQACHVSQVALPTMAIDWRPLTSCYGDIGLALSLIFTGSPPFHVEYELQRNKETSRTYTKRYDVSKAELTLQPSQEGHYLYNFLHISDSNYRRVNLPSHPIEQSIATPASASWAVRPSEGGKRIIWSCNSGFVPVEVNLVGTPPFSVEVRVHGQVLEFNELKKARSLVEIPITDELEQARGSFNAELLTVQDSRGCRTEVVDRHLQIVLKKARPTVSFIPTDAGYSFVMLEGENANLPIRLTGDGPWNIKYRRAELEWFTLTATLTTPDAFIPISDKGTYELLEVQDAHCYGDVVEGSYKVNWIPRPYAKLSRETVVTMDPYTSIHTLRPVCQGHEDFVDIDLFGKPPFQVTYSIIHQSRAGIKKALYSPMYNSPNYRTQLPLSTEEPGRVTYELNKIGDAIYPLSKLQCLEDCIDETQVLQLEQEVTVRPTARFESRVPLSYYLNEALVPKDRRKSDGLVVLEGLPPFQLQVTIKHTRTRLTETLTTEVHGNTWKVEFPSYRFKHEGEHVVTLVAVMDSSTCGRTLVDPQHNSITVNVGPLAGIVPLDGRSHYCVGEAAMFQLSGKAPWTVGYSLNGITSSKTIDTNPLRISLDTPGELVISSLTSNNIQQGLPSEYRYYIHRIPRAMVGHGGSIHDTIDEGGQAEIKFRLEGTPPFTFTYKHAERLPGDKPGRVLETHKVSHVGGHQYSVRASIEGIWTVTSISDKYCEYPASGRT